MEKHEISEKTFLSLHVVITIIGLTVWMIRLDDKVSFHEKVITEIRSYKKQVRRDAIRLDKRLYQVETKLHIKTIEEKDDEEE